MGVSFLKTPRYFLMAYVLTDIGGIIVFLFGTTRSLDALLVQTMSNVSLNSVCSRLHLFNHPSSLHQKWRRYSQLARQIHYTQDKSTRIHYTPP